MPTTQCASGTAARATTKKLWPTKKPKSTHIQVRRHASASDLLSRRFDYKPQSLEAHESSWAHKIYWPHKPANSSSTHYATLHRVGQYQAKPSRTCAPWFPVLVSKRLLVDAHPSFVRVIQRKVEIVTMLSQLRHPHAQPRCESPPAHPMETYCNMLHIAQHIATYCNVLQLQLQPEACLQPSCMMS